MIDRRQALKSIGVGTMTAWVGSMFPTRASFATERGKASVTPVREFALESVRLLDSEFSEAQARNAQYLQRLESDRLLHNFRINAGLTPKALT